VSRARDQATGAIAARVTHLAGPEAGFVAGASWTIHGGFTA
jgi:hypothetical protein